MRLDEPASADRQCDRRHGRQRLGHGGHRQTHRGQEHHERVFAAQHADREHHTTKPDSGVPQPSAELRKPLLQRGLRIPRIIEQPGDATEFCPKPGRDNDSDASAVHDLGPPVRHVQPVTERRPARDLHTRVFLDRHGLPGQRRLGDAQTRGLDESQVRRYHPARLQEHDISRHERCGIDLAGLTVASNRRSLGGHPAQCLHRALRTKLLHHTDHRVEHDDDRDRDGVDDLAKRRRDGGGSQQQQDQEVLELVEQHHRDAALLCHGELIRTEAFKTRGRFCARQPLRRRGAQ